MPTAKVYLGGGTGYTVIEIPATGVTDVTGTDPVVSSGGDTPNISIDVPGQTEGDLFFFDGTHWNRIPAGPMNFVLVSQGPGLPPVYAPPSGGGVAAVTASSPIASSGGATPNISFFIAGQAQGDVVYFNGVDWVRLPAGAVGQVLTTEGPGANPQWTTPATGVTSVTASAPLASSGGATPNISIAPGVQGDTLYFDGANWVRLAAGVAGQFLETLGVAPGSPQWSTLPAFVQSVTGGDAIEITGTAQNPIVNVFIAGQTEGDIIYFNGVIWTRLAAGTPGQVLTTEGNAAPPQWTTPDTSTQYAFVYRPGAIGPLAPNVFATWAALKTAMALVDGPKLLQIDDSVIGAGNAAVPAGAYGTMLYNVTMIGISNPPDAMITTLVMDDQAQFTALPFEIRELAVTTAATTEPVFSLESRQILLLEAVILTATGTQPLIDYAGGSTNSVIIASNVTTIGDGTHNAVDVEGGVTVTMFAQEDTGVQPHAFGGTGTARFQTGSDATIGSQDTTTVQIVPVIGSASRVIRIPFSATTPSKTTIPANALVQEAGIVIETPFPPGTAIELGQADNPSRFQTTADNTPSLSGLYQVFQDPALPGFSAASQNPLLVTVVAAVGPPGSGFAYVRLVPNPMS